MSVVIPFRNAAPHFRDQLKALAGQEFDGAWETVVVDNGSSDGSRAIAEAFLERLDLTIVDAADKQGAGGARNVGLGERPGGSCSSSTRTTRWLRATSPRWPPDSIAFDFVTSSFDHRTLNPEWVQNAHGPVWRDAGDPIPSQWGVLPFAGGSIGVSRSVFEAIGGFPEDLPRMEDIAFSWEVQLAGTKLHHVADAVYRVRYRNSLIGLLRQGLADGSTAPLLYRRYRSAGMERRSFAEMLRSRTRLVVQLLRARTKADLAPLMLQLGREVGRSRGSIRHRVYFP